MSRTIINEYVVIMENGNHITITTSNKSGAIRQSMSIKGAVSVERIYKNGKRAV